MKYSNLNLDIQQENIRQGIQLLLLSCNEIYEILGIEIEFIVKGLSGKWFKAFEQTPLKLSHQVVQMFF